MRRFSLVDQCSAIKKDGNQCTRKKAVGNYCRQHSVKLSEVDESSQGSYALESESKSNPALAVVFTILFFSGVIFLFIKQEWLGLVFWMLIFPTISHFLGRVLVQEEPENDAAAGTVNEIKGIAKLAKPFFGMWLAFILFGVFLSAFFIYFVLPIFYKIYDLLIS
jgi:hypothetical protein